MHRIDRGGNLPVSLNQELRLMLHLGNPQTNANLVGFGLNFEGEVESELLQAAINEVVHRHEVLRTRFLAEASFGPVRLTGWEKVSQVLGASGNTASVRISAKVQPSAFVRLEYSDLRSCNLTDQANEIAAVTRLALRSPYDYACPPFVRPVLIRQGDRRYMLIFASCHLVIDGLSQRIFEREMLAFYESLRLGIPHGLQDLPVQYVDFAGWQRHRLDGPLLETITSYWQNIKNSFPSLPAFGAEFLRKTGGAPDNLAPLETVELTPELSKSLHSLAKQGFLPYSIAVGSVGILLHRITGRERIPIRGTFGNRVHPDVQDLIGDFATAQLLGIQIAPDSTFRDVVSQAHAVILQAIAHQEAVPRFSNSTSTRNIVRSSLEPAGAESPAVFCEVVRETVATNIGGFSVRAVSLVEYHGMIVVPLKFTFVQSASGQFTKIVAAFHTQRYDREGVQKMLKSLLSILTDSQTVDKANSKNLTS